MATKQAGLVKARQAVVITVGARPPVYQTRIVRDRHTRKLVEVPMFPELPPLDEGSEGITYVFARGEEVEADHPAVLESPGNFIPIS